MSRLRGNKGWTGWLLRAGSGFVGEASGRLQESETILEERVKQG